MSNELTYTIVKLIPNHKTCRLYRDVEHAGGRLHSSAFLTLYNTDGSSILSLCGWQCISPLRTATCNNFFCSGLPKSLLVVHLVRFLKELHIVGSPIHLPPFVSLFVDVSWRALTSVVESRKSKPIRVGFSIKLSSVQQFATGTIHICSNFHTSKEALQKLQRTIKNIILMTTQLVISIDLCPVCCFNSGCPLQ